MIRFCLCLGLIVITPNASQAQDDTPADVPAATGAVVEEEATVADDGGVKSPDVTPEEAALETDSLEQAKESATGLVDDVKKQVGDVAKILDQNPRVQEASTSILEPVYQVARAITFPAFYWVAFALMSTGLVNFTFQLIPGKLVVLTQGSFSVREIISDTVGLAISVTGLVLTTQAATDNSTFTDSPSSVLSATGVGVLAGLILYRWNQTEEIQAAQGRRKTKRRK